MEIYPPNVVHGHIELLLTLMTQNIINRTREKVAIPNDLLQKGRVVNEF